ncbi:polysaccharide biosynthesis/export family protein [uncultured Sphingomonas sp.]|uniref:polysaccharide biosynthesis/export family protein n=1 Tax=uncultured Sphingomonas sp. TaxID=158754 RepID=UPI0035CC7EA9
MRSLLLGFLVTLLCAGCADRVSDLPVGESSFPVQAPNDQTAFVVLPDYRIGPLDQLKVVVFGEEDLSGELPVGLSGSVSLPLIGEVPAQGKTTNELALDIKRRLDQRYLRNASVSVSVVDSKNLTVTVDGEVKKPGIYNIPGRLTLMQAIALGEGATEYAKLSEVVIFRSFSGKRYAARFDLRDVRQARFLDPEIKQGDVVVVGYSAATRRYRDLLTSLPGLAGLFVALR